MSALPAEKLGDKQFSPREIREMLGVDNYQIQALCRFSGIKLKKNHRGLTYFTDEDVQTLKSISLEDRIKCTLPRLNAPAVQSERVNAVNAANAAAVSVSKIIDAVKNIEQSVADKVAGLLDEKLDGMDDVVMELIRIKSENETMRFKINELNKENYKLKKEINSFKKSAFGLYKKVPSDAPLQ